MKFYRSKSFREEPEVYFPEQDWKEEKKGSSLYNRDELLSYLAKNNENELIFKNQ